MKIPQSPPPLDSIQDRILANHELFKRLFEVSQQAVGDGKYLHWDKLRHLKPPTGLSHEEWWFGLKLARLGILKPLPLKDAGGIPFQFALPDPCQERLHHIDQDAGGRIEMPDRAITNPNTRNRYIVRSLVEEAITSSQLEGAATTRPVAKEMVRSGRMPRNDGEQMILNNYAAMQRIRELKEEPLTTELILELHGILTEKTLKNPSAVGRFRRPNERIQVADNYDVVFHTPPPANKLESRVKAMCDFANGNTPAFFIHPVVRAIILHFWLAYDHPFVDGNGRCARGLFYWSMARQGFWLCEFISISQIIRKAPAKYGRAFLYTETDGNDLTYFVLYHLEVIRSAITELHEYVAEKTRAIRRIEDLIKVSPGFNHRQLALLSHALRHPDTNYTVRSHQTSHNVVHQTARGDLYDLAKRGLLVQTKIGRTYVFRPEKDFEQRLARLE